MVPDPLSLLLAVAFGGSLLSFVAGVRARYVALAFAVATLGVVVYLLANFQLGNTTSFQYFESYNWFNFTTGSGPGIAVNYTVGIDGISLPMVLLSAIMTVATVIYHWDETKDPAQFFGLLMLTNAGVLGVFVSLDVLVFFVFWEVVLVPMFFLIAHWGGARRHYASLKFFVYTHVASVIMLVALVAMVFLGHWPSFDFADMVGRQQLDSQNIPQATQVLLFGSLLFGFGVKLPMVPFHTWLPDAHVEAPTGGSVMLAAVLLKMGAYGLIRLDFPLLVSGRTILNNELYVTFFLAFLSIVWGAYLSLAQRDLKRLVAYSSINHMGVVLLAISLWTQVGIEAAVLLMFAHGLVSGLLFMVSGSVHHTYRTRDIPSVGGMVEKTPILATMLIVGALASLGLPALVSFPAEFSAFWATWASITYWVFIPLLALVITAAFYIWMLQRMAFGPPRGLAGALGDLSRPEFVAMGMLVALIVLYGILPLLIGQFIPSSQIFTPSFPGGGGAWP